MCNCKLKKLEIPCNERQIVVDVSKFGLVMNDGTGKTPRKTVSIDICLIEELFELWSLGIKTTGCCCGHNFGDPYIGVENEFIPKMKKMGYKVAPNPMDYYRQDSFYPKSLKINYKELKKRLDESREKEIFKLRKEGLSLREIGLRVNLSHEAVRKLLTYKLTKNK